MAEPKPEDDKGDERSSESEKFEEFVNKIAAVPKEGVDEKRRQYERRRKEKRAG